MSSARDAAERWNRAPRAARRGPRRAAERRQPVRLNKQALGLLSRKPLSGRDELRGGAVQPLSGTVRNSGAARAGEI